MIASGGRPESGFGDCRRPPRAERFHVLLPSPGAINECGHGIHGKAEYLRGSCAVTLRAMIGCLSMKLSSEEDSDSVAEAGQGYPYAVSVKTPVSVIGRFRNRTSWNRRREVRRPKTPARAARSPEVRARPPSDRSGPTGRWMCGRTSRPVADTRQEGQCGYVVVAWLCPAEKEVACDGSI